MLMCIAYFQPITRGELSSFFGKEVSRDLIGHLRGAGLIASGPRSPTPGAPYTYVTTKAFLLEFGLDTLRDLPDFEALEDAGLLSKDSLLVGISCHTSQSVIEKTLKSSQNSSRSHSLR